MRNFFVFTLLSCLLIISGCKKDDEVVSGQQGSEQNSQEILDMIQMVYVEGGSFIMGTSMEQEGVVDEFDMPSHEVELSGFYIAKTEVTQALWKAVMKDNPSQFVGDDNLPVENVSYDDVQDFIKKLNKLTGKTFRLPTEEEWEYAARGGKNSHGYNYSGSDNVDMVAWYRGNSGNKTHAVGTKLSNELGIYDMSGNVFEWCDDWCDYYSNLSQITPSGSGEGDYRVYRGGGLFDDAWGCRVSHRILTFPYFSSLLLGFRLVLVQ